MFENVIGHDRIKNQFERAFEAGKLHHASLLMGPEHIGKMSLVREIVSQLRTGKAFDESSSFGKQIVAGEGSGLLAFYDTGESLKVDQVRMMKEFVSRRTAEGQWSFCLIEHLERMTHSAANAFLKVLEEPSQRMLYFMTTRSEKLLIPTVLSRVQQYRMSVVPGPEVQKFLEKTAHNGVLVEEVMKLSMGKIGLAITLLADQERLDRLRELYDYAALMLDKDMVERFALADHLTKKEVLQSDVEQFFVYLSLRLRHEGVRSYIPQLNRIQEVHELFASTQVNRRLFLEELFLSI
ncbi:MAG: hypothetical protein P1V18_06205 [Candidatus Gracilibacteria bacterium]|nr:hypothetical protein [Candidatus Gracilibacteria bacterium]